MSKRIVILAFGTRGDVQPYIPLALKLMRKGYDVLIGATLEFEQLITNSGVAYGPLKVNLQHILFTESGRESMDSSKDKIKDEADFFELLLTSCWHLAQKADLLIYDTMLSPVCYIAEQLNIPMIMSSVMPNSSPTKAFPMIGISSKREGEWWNRFSYQLARFGWWQSYRDIRNWCQSHLNVKPSRWRNYWYSGGKPIPVLYSYSRHVLPMPEDWNVRTLASGYWFWDGGGQELSEELQRFIDEGKQPPMYIGFGSMVGLDSEKVTEVVLSAVAETGQRAVIATGWGGLLKKEGENLFFVDSVPHHLLFPQMKVIVHHGGAGTTAAALRFGKPSVICPFVTDQFFWGDLLYKRGLGAEPMPQKELTTNRLVGRLNFVLDNERIEKNCLEMSEKITNEKSIEQAIIFIEAYLT